jgi:ribose transport system substrate-binding protein
MNPALSISSLSRILASRNIAVLSLALALFGLSLPVAKAQKLRIGISMKTLNAPYFAAQGKAAEEEVKKLGGTAISSDAENDMMKQIADVEDMLAKGIDGLILNPGDLKVWFR